MTTRLPSLLLCALAAQAQPPAPTPITVIDAVVLDAAGHPVTNLTAADFEIAAAGKTVAPLRVTALDNVHHSAATSTSLPAIELTPDQIGRTTVIVIDDLCLPLEGIRNVRQQVQHFIADLLAPGDQAAILWTSGGSARDRQITRDRRHLNQIINSTEYLGSTLPSSACATAAWTTVANALTGLASLPGRKALLLMSGDLRSPAGNAAAQIERLAAASMTAIYQSSAAETQFAAFTGGAAGVDLDHVIAETAAYYLLAVQAPGREVQVHVRRPGVTLRARRETALPSPPSSFPAPDDAEDAVIAALNSPFEGSAIGLRITPLFTNTSADGSVLELLCHIDARDLSYLRDPQGRYDLSFEVGAASVVEAGTAGKPVGRAQELHLSPEEYQRAVTEGIVVNLRLAWGLSPRDVRVIVADHRSGRMGGASAFVQAHNPAAGTFFLSGIALKGDDSVKQSAAVRVFPGGSSLTFLYNLYNATVDPEGRSRVQVRSRLFAGGHEAFVGTPNNVTFEKSTDPRRHQISGRIILQDSLSPGRYILQVTVTDALAPQPRTAGQFTAFTVEP